jgi:crotonobetainyl-CoA:carnitine CoA-transferase CaiB-like acyl-CoA transferase
MQRSHSAHQALAGIVAVELGHSVAAPYAGQILAALGAEVIKVENPQGGDDARGWGPPFWHGASATFQSLNRDKLGIAIDYKSEADRARLRRLIAERADIVFQNLRPGQARRFGLDAATLRTTKPGLIYCNVGAFGAKGPLKDRPGYDPLMQAFAGIMSVTGEDGRPPVRVAPSIIDKGTGMWAAIGILAALHHRNKAGEGCEVDTSLYETAMAWMTMHCALFAASGTRPRRSGTEVPMLAPYRAYKASDDYVVLAAGNDALFRRLCQVLGHGEWADDPRFARNADRVANRAALNALIESAIGAKPRAHWVEAFDRAGVPCAPHQTIDEMLAHPQTAALGQYQSSPDGKLAIMGVPLSFDGVRPPFRGSPPGLGEHNTRILGGPAPKT